MVNLQNELAKGMDAAIYSAWCQYRIAQGIKYSITLLTYVPSSVGDKKIERSLRYYPSYIRAYIDASAASE